MVHFAVIKNPAVITNPEYPVRYFFKIERIYAGYIRLICHTFKKVIWGN